MLNNHAMASLKQVRYFKEIQLCLFGQARDQHILDVARVWTYNIMHHAVVWRASVFSSWLTMTYMM